MIIACYARKSNNKKTDSIENQFAIINGYITKQSDFQNAEILYFSDNGSGINMEREQFQELLTKVRQREIDVVIVKDFSRLGRNYLDVCKLKDSIFPFMKIRLIAVSENYDSEHPKTDMSDFSATFRSVLNEYYVLESSEKIFKSCEQQIRDGKFIGRIPYGFFLSDRSTVCIQEEQAKIVKEIFSMFLGGKSVLQIVKNLN